MDKRILCYGDSNTWGFIPGSGERYPENIRWTGICKQLLGSGYTIIENGINGRTTIFDQPFNSYLNGLKGLGYALLSQAPIDLVVMFLGTNDITLHDMYNVQIGIDEIIRICVNANTIYRAESAIFRKKPEIILITPPPFLPIVDSLPGSANGRYQASLGFQDAYAMVAKKYNIRNIDASKCSELSSVDGVHLTAKGHSLLGNAVAEEIRLLLEK